MDAHNNPIIIVRNNFYLYIVELGTKHILKSLTRMSSVKSEIKRTNLIKQLVTRN